MRGGEDPRHHAPGVFDYHLAVSDNNEQRGPVAQLGARFHGMEEVVGSIPTRSTI
jgi:hypothetical protein